MELVCGSINDNSDNVQVEDSRNKIMMLKETSDITFSRILVNIFLANINTIIILNVFLMAILVGLIFNKLSHWSIVSNNLEMIVIFNNDEIMAAKGN